MFTEKTIKFTDMLLKHCSPLHGSKQTQSLAYEGEGTQRRKQKWYAVKNIAPISLGWRASFEKLLLLIAEDDVSLGRERKGKQKSLWYMKTTKQKRLTGELIFMKCKRDCSKIRDNSNLIKAELFWIEKTRRRACNLVLYYQDTNSPLSQAMSKQNPHI